MGDHLVRKQGTVSDGPHIRRLLPFFLLKCLVAIFKFPSSWAQVSKTSIRELYTGGYLSVKLMTCPMSRRGSLETRLCHFGDRYGVVGVMDPPLS